VLSKGFSFINESFEASEVSPSELDQLLSEGWRHFGRRFFRYNLAPSKFEVRFVLPLRIRLDQFEFSKSQRRILRKNSDLGIVIRPIEIDLEKIELFELHKKRFNEFTPDSIYDFFDKDAASTPCESFEICVYSEDRSLLAVSFFDKGAASISSTYAMFDPANAPRSLGIFTMLKEIEYAAAAGKQLYYHGYAYAGESFYDYKKRFASLETYDWNGNWIDFER
jgi:arginine-tRNA-protein transferase